MKPKIFDNFADYHVFSCGSKGRVRRVGDTSFMDNEEINELCTCLEFVISKIERLNVKCRRKTELVSLLYQNHRYSIDFAIVRLIDVAIHIVLIVKWYMIR
jgi:hypothetical protein